MFTLKQLNEIMPQGAKLKRTDKFYSFILGGMRAYNITTVERAACFLATVAVETGEFQYVRELWGPTSQQLKYDPPNAKARELGNINEGDGFKYRGRGLIQITGRDNYARASVGLNQDFVAKPELIEQPLWAVEVSCWWWTTHDCNRIADTKGIIGVSRKVNLGNENSSATPNHMEQRQAYFNKAMTVLNRPDFSNVESGVETWEDK